MIENEIIKMCITIRKKKLDRAQIQTLKYRNMHEEHSVLVKDAKKKLEEYESSIPSSQNKLFSSIKGKNLDYFDLNIYFSELEKLSKGQITLKKDLQYKNEIFENSKIELNKQNQHLSQIRKKYEKTQKIEEEINSELKIQFLTEEDDNIESIALTQAQNKIRQKNDQQTNKP